jgi:hypothetical protein
VVAAQKYADGFVEGTTHGPIQNKMQFDIVTGLVDDAKASGAEILCGGTRLPGSATGSYFYAPTIIAKVQEGWRRCSLGSNVVAVLVGRLLLTDSTTNSWVPTRALLWARKHLGLPPIIRYTLCGVGVISLQRAAGTPHSLTIPRMCMSSSKERSLEGVRWNSIRNRFGKWNSTQQ